MYYDDEDRLIRDTSSGGLNETFVYNGLGLRVGKTDSTGTYSYLCDGSSPGSSVHSDGAAVYTPGQSEHRAGASSYPDFDSLGNILMIDANSGYVMQAGYMLTGFGTPEYGTGSSPTPFKYGGANGCQTDNDTGLILMGHRYYDTRIGRFISKDSAGEGDNWYAYCNNSPLYGVDPDGLKRKLTKDQEIGQMESVQNWDGGPYRFDDEGGLIYHGKDGTENQIQPFITDIPKSGGSDLGFGGLVDEGVTFGTVQRAGQIAGEYDSGKASRRAAIGTGALAVGAVLAAGASEGKDAAEADAAKFLTKELISQSRIIAKGDAVDQAERLADRYGGRTANWVKKSTPFFEHPETGADVEIHWFENLKDNIGRVEQK